MSEEETPIQYRTVGRTGLNVSQIGLGGGGKSCLGRNKGKTEAESVQVVKRAIELGINFIDTSSRNATEHIVGHGIRGFDRDSLVISTKCCVSVGNVLTTPVQFSRSLEASLKALDTPYIDIMHFQGVLPNEYDYMVSELLPVMEKYRDSGEVRHIGLTEHFDRDRDHKMLQRALEDDYWDVIMVGFNMINQSARDRVFARALKSGIGILGMFAVRRALTSIKPLEQTLRDLQSIGELPVDLDIAQTIKQLSGQQQQSSIAKTAYRYCRDEPAIHSVLMGTGEISHLEQNLKTFGEPPLNERTRQFIADTFGHISNFSGN